MLSRIFQIILIVFILVLAFTCLSYAHQAIVLSDKELDGISAAGFDIDINAVLAFRSAVAVQSNIAAINSLGASAVSVTNSNFAQVYNIGNSAVAVQNNIAAIVAERGDITDAVVNNSNISNIDNMVNATGQVEANSLDMGNTLNINQVSAVSSAIASQSNVAVVAALNGEIHNTVINNYNEAGINNLGNSAVSGQSNIGVIVAQGDIDGALINNTNVANITNIFNGASGGVNLHNFTYQGPIWGNLNINHFSVHSSAEARQNNIGLIISISGIVKNSLIKDNHSANVSP